jgi:hypothetical protein
MSATSQLPDVTTDDKYRTIPQSRIVDLLVHGGWAYEADLAHAQQETRCSLDYWRELGLGSVLSAEGKRLFDPVEVLNFSKRIGLDGKDDFWRTHFVPTGRRFVSDLAEGTACDRLFKVEVRRTFHLHGVAPGTRLRLRMPLPLEGPYLDHLQIEPGCDAAGAEIDLRSGRLEVRLIAAREQSVTASAKLAFIAHEQRPTPGKKAPPLADRELYLRAKEGLIVVTERIKSLATSLAIGLAPADAIHAFWDYLHRHLKGGALHYDQLDLQAPGDWILYHGWFDCRMGSTLFATLCRAHGIPARVCSGWMLYPKAPFIHYWAEAWLEDRGWVPCDFVGWDLSEGGRDLAWRDHFFGRLDARITTERLPREFTGAVGISIPPDWHLLQSSGAEGMQTELLTRTGKPLYTDTIRILP